MFRFRPPSPPVQALLPPDLIPGRTHRRSAQTAGNPRATVNHGFRHRASARSEVTHTTALRRRPAPSSPPSTAVDDCDCIPAHHHSVPLISGSDLCRSSPFSMVGTAAFPTAVATPEVLTPAELEFHALAELYTHRD